MDIFQAFLLLLDTWTWLTPAPMEQEHRKGGAEGLCVPAMMG